MNSIALNMDCMDFLREQPDKAFDLAIVDPPYGIGEDGSNRPSRGRVFVQPHIRKDWDATAPKSDYFHELRRVSKNQIIWGANHFISQVPFDSSCWIVWNKKTAGNTADCELAFTSFKTAVRRFDFMWEGFWQEDMANKERRIHPTQKPVALYKWLLQNYAKPGDTILDTHLGSGSSRIAAYDLGFDFTGIELDPDYFAAQEARFAAHVAQGNLFIPEAVAEQPTFL